MPGSLLKMSNGLLLMILKYLFYDDLLNLVCTCKAIHSWHALDYEITMQCNACTIASHMNLEQVLPTISER